MPKFEFTTWPLFHITISIM